MNIDYFSRAYSKSLSFCLPTFGLSAIFPQIAGHWISFGGWLRLTVDEVHSPSPSLEQQFVEEQIYHNLGQFEIRLLKLYPAKRDEPLRGELFTSALGRGVEEYAAISYFWGPTDSMRTILLHNVQVPIRQNLEQCLRALRDEDHEIVVWTDALCINQANIEEKSTQVNMMGNIYESANTVNVWLGTEKGHSGVGMRVLEYFATNSQPTREAPWLALPPDIVALGLSEVISRPWFKRMWVVQEVGLSRKTKMICGGHSFVWNNTGTWNVRRFVRMIKYAAIQPEWRGSELARVDMNPLLELLDLQVGRMFDKSWGSTNRIAPDVLDIAYDLRHRNSSDPRDMIFALQGLVKDHFSGERLQPDYTLTVGETYEHLTSVIEF